MKNKNYLLIFIFSTFCLFTYSQEVKVYEHFKDFEPILTNKNDTTYVINFWSTWCKPCVKEMPHFQKANEKFKAQKFKMLLVSLDFKTQIGSKVKPFINDNGIEVEVVLLADMKHHIWIDKVNSDWSGSIPVTVIFNKDFYFFKEGSMNFEDLNEIITKNIKQ